MWKHTRGQWATGATGPRNFYGAFHANSRAAKSISIPIPIIIPAHHPSFHHQPSIMQGWSSIIIIIIIMSFFIQYEYHYVWLSPYLHNIPPNKKKKLPNIVLRIQAKKKNYGFLWCHDVKPPVSRVSTGCHNWGPKVSIALTCGQYHWSHPWGARAFVGGLGPLVWQVTVTTFWETWEGKKHLQT